MHVFVWSLTYFWLNHILLPDVQALKGLTLPPQDDGSGGSLHMVDFLVIYGSFISSNLKDVAQIKSDISSLADSLSQLPCKNELPEVPTPDLRWLMSDKTEYSDSVTQSVLLRIQMVVTGLDNVPCWKMDVTINISKFLVRCLQILSLHQWSLQHECNFTTVF